MNDGRIAGSSVFLRSLFWLSAFCTGLAAADVRADEAAGVWNYRPELLQPFWRSELVEGESVLFLKQDAAEPAEALLLFPVQSVVSVCNSAGDVIWEADRDYTWEQGSRRIRLTQDSRIPAFSEADLRRPAGSQKYRLTHRDGNGEILFGAELEYAAMQVCVTYRRAAGQKWMAALPDYSADLLPRTTTRLQQGQPVTLVTLGDSISAGSNASGLYDQPPYQPAYPELVRRGLDEASSGDVAMINLAVGGTSTDWGLQQVDAVAEKSPDLLIIAFGMNDSAGRSAESYQMNIQGIITAVRERSPHCEFILVASMLGNRDWTTLQHGRFAEYRTALQELSGPGIAVADLTSVWEEFLVRKKDCDQTGNGVNHPNDFGHRVYAQVILSLLSNP